MKLLKIHQLLIACAIVLCALYAAWSLLSLSRGGGTSAGLMAALSAAAGVGLALYLRQFRRRIRDAAPPAAASPEG